jgi:hypothetical protein
MSNEWAQLKYCRHDWLTFELKQRANTSPKWVGIRLRKIDTKAIRILRDTKRGARKSEVRVRVSKNCNRQKRKECFEIKWKTSCVSPCFSRYCISLFRENKRRGEVRQRTIEFFVTSVSGLVSQSQACYSRGRSYMRRRFWREKLVLSRRVIRLLCSSPSWFFYLRIEMNNWNCQLRLPRGEQKSRHVYNGNEKRERLFLLVIHRLSSSLPESRRYETWHVMAIRERERERDSLILIIL